MIKIKDLIKKHRAKRFIDVSEQDFTVHLKPFLGIRPALYLSCFAIVLLILLLFFLLLFPGIKKNGSIVTVHSNPSFAALYIDGKYQGETPLSLFVPKGVHSFEIRYTGSKTNNFEKAINGRVVGSLLFPKKEKIFLKTVTDDPLKKAQATLARFFQLSCYHTFESGTLPPPLLTKATHHILAAEDQSAAKKAFDTLFFPTFLVANTPELKNDLFQAFLLASKIYQKEGEESYLTAARALIEWSKNYPFLYFEYYSYFTPEQRKTIRKTPFFQKYKELLINYLSYPSSAQLGKATGKKKIIQGIEFHEYRGGIARLSDDWTEEALKKIIDDQRPSHIPLLYHLSSFWLATKPISGNQFQSYLKQNPQQEQKWLSLNQINRYYNPSFGDKPVVAISYFAATDYLNQFQWRLPSMMELFHANINKELKKEQPTFTNDSSSLPFQEWTLESYANAYLLFQDSLPEGAVYLHNQQPHYTSYPKEFCTEATGFRPSFSNNPIKMLPLDFDFSNTYYKAN